MTCSGGDSEINALCDILEKALVNARKIKSAEDNNNTNRKQLSHAKIILSILW